MHEEKDLVDLRDARAIKEKDGGIVFRGGEIIDAEVYEQYPATTGTKKNYLGFLLENEEYVVEMERIKEIIKLKEITEIPGSPPHLLGIISLRGIVVPIIDARKRLGLVAKEPDERSRIIVLYNEDEFIGILVDKITGIMELSEDKTEPPPDSLTPDEAKFIRGINRFGERIVIILNTERVLSL